MGAGGRSAESFFGRLRAVPSAAFANAVVVLYAVSVLLGAIVYLYFKVEIGPELERDGHWQALGFLDLKEDFISIGLGLLPAYWVCWRRHRPTPWPDTRCSDRDPRVHRLVGLSYRSRSEQHHGFRGMTSSPLPQVRICIRDSICNSLRGRARRDVALFTVYPSLGIVLLGMHRSRDVADPAIEFIAPEMWWYGWTATAAIGALMSASLPRLARLLGPTSLVWMGMGGSLALR